MIRLIKKKLLERVKKRKVTLTRQYVFYACLVVAMTLFFSIWLSLSEFKAYQNQRDLILRNEAFKLSFELEQNVSYARNINRFFANKILESGDYSPENISFIISNKGTVFSDDVFTWTLVDFVNVEKKIIVDSVQGTLTQKPSMEKVKRSWIQKTRENPWTLFFAKPDVGLVSKEMVISTGIGITDEQGIFKGYLSTSINLKKLNNSLRKVINKDLVYVVLDEEYSFILASEPTITSNNFTLGNDNKEIIKASNTEEVTPLSEPIILEDKIYYYKAKVAGSPYMVFVGEQLGQHYKNFVQGLLPQILRNMVIGIMCVAMLLYLGYRMANPVMELSKLAQAVSEGKKASFPAYDIQELNILSRQLASIQNIYENLRKKQKELLCANHDLQTANNFIRSNMSFLSHELRNPLSSLIGFVEVLKNSAKEVKDEGMLEIIDIIHKIALYQDRQIDFFLRFCEFQERGKAIEKQEVDLKEVIEWNVNMVKHHAKKQNVKIHIDCQKGLPAIIGDKLMLGQMIQNFVTNGIKYNKKNGSLWIKAYVRQTNKRNELVLQFKDIGIGIEEKNVAKIFEKFKRIKTDKDKDTVGYGLGLNYAQDCIVAHDATIEVQSKLGVGTVFTIVFPRSRIVEPKKQGTSPALL